MVFLVSDHSCFVFKVPAYRSFTAFDVQGQSSSSLRISQCTLRSHSKIQESYWNSSKQATVERESNHVSVSNCKIVFKKLIIS